MRKAYGFVAFVAGAAIGSAASWYFLKTKYERIAQEEIDSVKEVFSKRRASSFTPVADIHVDTEEVADKVTENLKEYVKKIDDEGYTDYSNLEAPLPEAKQSKSVETVEVPYVISPEEFDEFEDYDTISLTLYSDGVLTDDLDIPVEDVEGTVGSESLNHFGEYEDDSVFVRNDRLKADYEILLDLRKYSDVLKTKPRGFGGFYGKE